MCEVWCLILLIFLSEMFLVTPAIFPRVTRKFVLFWLPLAKLLLQLLLLLPLQLLLQLLLLLPHCNTQLTPVLLNIRWYWDFFFDKFEFSNSWSVSFSMFMYMRLCCGYCCSYSVWLMNLVFMCVYVNQIFISWVTFYRRLCLCLTPGYSQFIAFIFRYTNNILFIMCLIPPPVFPVFKKIPLYF